jgi:hypothetical protein
MLTAWQNLTSALNPAPENYLSHMHAASADGEAAVDKDAPAS